MKSKFEFLMPSFIIIGAVIGAGFISGHELLRFFGGSFLLPSVVLSFFLFYFICILFLTLGKKYKNFQSLCVVFKRFSKLVFFTMLVFNLILMSAMLSGVESLFGIIIGNVRLPVFSVISLMLAALICGKGINGVAKINLFLIPCILIFIIVYLTLNFKFDFVLTSKNAVNSVAVVYFYAAMNMFLAAPVLLECGSRFSRKACKQAALFSAFVLAVCIFLIVTCLLNSGAINPNLPLLSIFESNPLTYYIFCILIYFAIFTSIITSYYPVFSYTENKYARIFTAVCALLVSQLGLSNIVGGIYPVIGIVSGVLIVFIFFRELIL